MRPSYSLRFSPFAVKNATLATRPPGTTASTMDPENNSFSTSLHPVALPWCHPEPPQGGGDCRTGGQALGATR